MSIIAPPFVTNHEIDAFLGGGSTGKRHRQRLQKNGSLPAPQWLGRIDRFRVGVYPAFALAGLVDTIADLPDAQQRLSRLSTRVLTSAAFRDLSEAVAQSARDVVGEHGVDEWEFGAVVRRLSDLATPAIEEWDDIVHEAAEGLAQWGIRLSHEFGSIESKAGGMYVVSLAEERQERFAPACVVAGLPRGSRVAVKHVGVMGRGLDYVIPTLETRSSTAATADLDWSNVTDEAWADSLRATRADAQRFSFGADYWQDDASSGADTDYAMPPSLVSGREAAARLLTARR
jgi:hypothetical protein